MTNNDTCRRSLSGCHVTPGGCQKGGWEGPCACLPGLGMTSHLLSTGCACWGMVTWRSSVVLGVVVGDDGCCVSPCHRVSSTSSLRCGRFVVLDGCGGWVASSMVVVGRKKRHGNV